MWATTVIAIFILGFVSGVFSDTEHLPSYLTACKRDAPDFEACCLASARAGLPHIVKGDKNYGIPNFKPLKIEKVEIKTPTLAISIKDVSLWGMHEADIQDFKMDIKNQHILIKFKTPSLEILGKYETDGKILVIPLKGSGDLNITLDNPVFEYSFDYKLVKKGNHEYLTLTEDGEFSYTMDKATILLDNLFDGNEQLTKSTNEVLNKEWKLVLEELNPAIKTTIKTIATSIINGIASRVPYENLFL